MNISQLLKEAEYGFSAVGLSTPGLDAEVLLAFSIDRERHYLYAHPENEVSLSEMERFRSLVARRMKREPVAYITGRKEFWSLVFQVTPDVLIPRPDTEVLVEAIVKLSPREREKKISILEIGTGSGAICVALASELNNASITATDCSSKALTVAEKNAVNNHVAHKISFVYGDMFDSVTGTFDFIVSNPPYISKLEFDSLDEEVRKYEPYQALVAGSEGTELHRQLVRKGKHFLEKGGWLIMEIGAGQRSSVEKMLKEEDYCDIDFSSDYAGIERVALARKRG
ncbi:MAG TPA: peptide chain release factor N(5)-glutamine methyltransferase [Syntrophales bacterium]|nr:peptide chain release factor N(5)-glutamine methyltransferase [Syntrophales bacterium]HPQ43309.1 peptide chain release factor N(5)-glutamine methyltransferase [Syntrophales bacterium]